jgi:hypothetical protein
MLKDPKKINKYVSERLNQAGLFNATNHSPAASAAESTQTNANQTAPITCANITKRTG